MEIQVNYELASLHAALEDDVYVDLPRGFWQPRRVLKLLKSLYGLKQSLRNFLNI